MSLIQFTLERNTIGDDLQRLVDKIANPGNAQKRMISDGIRQQFQANFSARRSGNGPWASLAPSTVLDRVRKGYPGNQPILVRSGNLRDSYVNAGSPDHHTAVFSSGGYTVFEEGTDNRIAIFHERGTSRMAQRSVTLLDDGQTDRLATIIEWVVGQIEAQTVGR